MGIQYSLVNLVWDTTFTSEYCMRYSIHWWLWGVQFSLGVIRYSLVNNVCGYDNHWASFAVVKTDSPNFYKPPTRLAVVKTGSPSFCKPSTRF